jgi:hypothetical protein
MLAPEMNPVLTVWQASVVAVTTTFDVPETVPLAGCLGIPACQDVVLEGLGITGTGLTPDLV